MSDINLDFVVSNNEITFTVEPNDITFTPSDVQLTIATGGLAFPANPPNSVQYNKVGVFGGSAAFIFHEGNLTLSIENINVSGNSYIANANITSNVEDTHILGGTNGYVLQTDGTGNLSWTAQGGGGGNGVPGGSNTQVQFNDAGTFGGNAGFTFNKLNGNVNMLGNLIVAGNLVALVANANYASYAGNVTISAQPNITSLGTLTSLVVSGNVSTTGTTKIQQAKEKVTIDSSALGPPVGINFDLLTQAVLFYNGTASGLSSLNFRGNSSVSLNSVMADGESMTCALLINTGVTPYYPNTFSIDGTTVTIKWLYPFGPPSTAIASATNVYNFNIIKTASNTFTVLGNYIGYQ